MVPVYVDSRQPFTALEFDVAYAPGQVRAIGVRRGPSAARALLARNASTAGRLRVALASAEAIATTGEPVLFLQVEGAPRAASSIRLSMQRVDGVVN